MLYNVVLVSATQQCESVIIMQSVIIIYIRNYIYSYNTYTFIYIINTHTHTHIHPLLLQPPSYPLPIKSILRYSFGSECQKYLSCYFPLLPIKTRTVHSIHWLPNSHFHSYSSWVLYPTYWTQHCPCQSSLNSQSNSRPLQFFQSHKTLASFPSFNSCQIVSLSLHFSHNWDHQSCIVSSRDVQEKYIANHIHNYKKLW